MGNVEEKLAASGYEKIRRNKWINGNRVVQVEHSVDYGRNHLRIWWKEVWRDYYAIVFDYSRADGPICAVPCSDLFRSSFVNVKRRQESYENSGDWWSQRFPINHELVRLVLSFKNRWDIL